METIREIEKHILAATREIDAAKQILREFVALNGQLSFTPSSPARGRLRSPSPVAIGLSRVTRESSNSPPRRAESSHQYTRTSFEAARADHSSPNRITLDAQSDSGSDDLMTLLNGNHSERSRSPHYRSSPPSSQNNVISTRYGQVNKTRRAKWTTKETEDLVELRGSGMSYGEIANRLGVKTRDQCINRMKVIKKGAVSDS